MTSRRLLVYVSSPDGAISDEDIVPFTDLLYKLEADAPVDLLLQTPGGDIDKAEKLVFLLRARASHVRVIVPESAKSAGTLIACAANDIMMSDTSELGPIDPQVFMVTPSGKEMYRPAHSFLAGLRQIQSQVDETGKLSPVFFPLLQHLDPALIDYCDKAITRSKTFAQKWLSLTQCEDKQKAAQIAERLADANHYESHGAVINYEEAREIGLSVTYKTMDDPLWERLWRLYCLYEIVIRQEGKRKVFESSNVSLTL